MNLTGFSMKNPFAVIALVLVVVALGAFAFFRTPTDLFPPTVPPQVVVITVYPGADAGDVADKITQVVEKELNTLDGLTKVTSTSRDEVSSVNAEFDYSKPIGDGRPGRAERHRPNPRRTARRTSWSRASTGSPTPRGRC